METFSGGARKHLKTSYTPQHLNARNEKPEILSEADPSGEAAARRAITGEYCSIPPSDPTVSTQNLVFLYFNTRVLNKHLFTANNLPLFSVTPSYTYLSCCSRFISISRFLPSPSFCASVPCLLWCFAPDLMFPPVGPCVCCNELYLIAIRDPQP